MHPHATHRLIRHGIAAMIVALIGGFALTFEMLQGISLSPLPVFLEYDLPGTERGWRILHLGMLLNGIMAIVLGFALARVAVTARGAAIASWGIVIAVWGNGMFYLFGMFAANHGLSLQDSPLGEASLAGAAAFLPALIGAVSLLVALIVMQMAGPGREPA